MLVRDFRIDTDLLAIYAAAVATVVLLWDIYKWKISGPRIRFRVISDMEILGDPRVSSESIFIHAEATNVGNLPTTVRILGVRHYNGWLGCIFRRADYKAIVPETVLQPLPHLLEPGKIWSGLIVQTPEIERLARDGILVCELFVSYKKRPITARIRVEKPPVTGQASAGEIV